MNEWKRLDVHYINVNALNLIKIFQKFSQTILIAMNSTWDCICRHGVNLLNFDILSCFQKAFMLMVKGIILNSTDNFILYI